MWGRVQQYKRAVHFHVDIGVRLYIIYVLAEQIEKKRAVLRHLIGLSKLRNSIHHGVGRFEYEEVVARQVSWCSSITCTYTTGTECSSLHYTTLLYPRVPTIRCRLERRCRMHCACVRFRFVVEAVIDASLHSDGSGNSTASLCSK